MSTPAFSLSALATPVKRFLPVPTAEQQRILDRIGSQRERLRARRAAQAQALAFAESNRATEGGAGALLLIRAVARLAREHPWAAAASTAVAVAAGPRRLVRWAGVLLPLLLRMRR